jgi:hypothetical protein
VHAAIDAMHDPLQGGASTSMVIAGKASAMHAVQCIVASLSR